jgi:hypothetical protein
LDRSPAGSRKRGRIIGNIAPEGKREITRGASTVEPARAPHALRTRAVGSRLALVRPLAFGR